MVGIFGVRGELKLQASRVGEDVFALRAPGAALEATLRFDDGRAPRPLRITSSRRHKNGIVARVEGIDDVDAAQLLVGGSIDVPRETVELGADEYFDDELVGCRIVQENRTLGTVAAVRHYPAQDVIELENGGMVPLVRAFVREIDLATRTVRVELPPGLLEGEPEIG